MEKIDKLKKEKQKIEEEIKKLEDTDILKKYVKLQDDKKEVDNEIYEYYKKIGFKKYDNCNHIYVMIKIEGKQNIKRRYLPKICIKCGLDESTKSGLYKYLSLEEKIMRDYLFKHPVLNKRCINISCNPDLAKLIYLKLKEANLASDDDTLIKNFISVIDSISNDNEPNIDEKIKLLLKK